MTPETLIEMLQQLKLPGMSQALKEQFEHPPCQDLSFHERLGMLIDRESLYRGNRRITTLLKQAKLRYQASVEGIDYQHARQLNKSQFISLSTCEFVRYKHNLLITGPTGCGKSYLACAIGHQACRLGLSVRYLRVSRFLEELGIAHADGSYGKILSQLAKIDLLILDDFGMGPGLTPQQHRDLFNVIEDRYQLRSTLITSQLPVKHWHEYIGEPTTADAILDRILEKAHRVELKGESLRKMKTIE